MKILTVLAAFLLAGCAHYKTPAGGLSIADIDDGDLRALYEREPQAEFPANLAVVRIQDSGYATQSAYGYGQGRYTVVTTRDIEDDEDVERLQSMPMVAGVAPLGRLLLPPRASTLRDLRAPAAALRADLLLVYSVDTTFTVGGKPLGPLSLISLGLLPNKEAHVTATVAGALIDVRSGFVYGTTEATAREQQSATIWSTEGVIDSARLDAEAKAFEAFVTEFEDLWTAVVVTHAT